MNNAHIQPDKRDLASFDAEVDLAIKKEQLRQFNKLELIASENYVSNRVLEAAGSVFTNKYAEGYPYKRYYGGCENIDIVETLAIERSAKLFSAECVNVQPHSGSQANMAAYLSLLKPADKIMGMNLSHGGHLTHGAKVNFSGFLFDVVDYGVRKDNNLIDYDEVLSIAQREKPKMIIAGTSAYSRKLDFKIFREIADQVGAFLVTDMAHIAGLVAAGMHPSPIKHSHITTSTTHKTLRGPRGGVIFCDQTLIKKVNSKIFPGIQGGPLCHIIAAKAVAFKEALEPEFKAYASQVIKNASTLANNLIDKGYHIVSGGTDNHMFLVDLRNKNITGKEAERSLDMANITLNKNTVPFETLSPFVTSGVRIGSAALTTRGFKEKDMSIVADYIDQAICCYDDEDKLTKIGQSVSSFAKHFPLFTKFG
ncbi:MAG: serine hydroxymethyltransferase [SAR324 cluster bacterium]|nr:serine hydroxymethyltransferase [SAR324 cluster bacterium]